MLLNQVLIRNRNRFDSAAEEWAKNYGAQVNLLDNKENLNEQIDSMIIFSADQNISKEVLELRKLMEQRNKPVHLVDINGTIRASAVSFQLWLDNNTPQKTLVVGEDDLVDSSRLKTYFERLGEVISQKN